MTVDSKYFMETYAVSQLDPVYPFSFESIGPDVLVPWITYYDETGTFVSRAVETSEYTVVFGGQEPIYQRGEVEILDTDATLPGTDVTLLFLRKTPILQELDLIPYTTFPSESAEFSLDRLTFILQEIDGNKCDCSGGDVNVVVPPEPNPAPECQPYDCDAYADYLAASGETYGISYTTTLDPLDWPFPNLSDKFRVYYDFISAPSIVLDYTPGDPTNNIWTRSTADLSGLGQPDFCGGPVQQLLCWNGASGGFPQAMVPASNESGWGDHTLEILLTGFNGGSTINGTLLRNSGKRFNITRNNTNVTLAESNISVSASSSGNDLTLTGTITAFDTGWPTVTDSITIVGKNDTLLKVVASIESSDPYEALIPTLVNRWIVVHDVTIKIECDGQSVVISGTQAYQTNQTVGSKPITNLTQVDHTLYTLPRMFYSGAQLSFAAIKWGVYNEETVGLSNIAYERTFTDYTPPGYCNA